MLSETGMGIREEGGRVKEFFKSDGNKREIRAEYGR
jgi:hypothetical protein